MTECDSCKKAAEKFSKEFFPLAQRKRSEELERPFTQGEVREIKGIASLLKEQAVFISKVAVRNEVGDDIWVLKVIDMIKRMMEELSAIMQREAAGLERFKEPDTDVITVDGKRIESRHAAL